MVMLRSIAIEISTSVGIAASSCGSSAFTLSTVSIMLAPDWRNTITITACLPLASPSLRTSSTESHDLRHVGQPDRRAVAIGDDERPVIGRAARLVVGIKLVVAAALFDRAFRGVGISRSKRRPHILEADAVFGQRLGIELDPHSRQRRAADEHLTDPIKLRQTLLQDRAARHRRAGPESASSTSAPG